MRPPWHWNCDHETPLHNRLLQEVARGALRHCPRCGAHPVKHKYGFLDWGPPRAEWQEANPPPRGREIPRVGTDWSQPRMIPWLPDDHPNYWVTSEKEALRVCKQWGINPDLPGGFISETHRERAFTAARRNRLNALRALPIEEKRRLRPDLQRRAGL